MFNKRAFRVYAVLYIVCLLLTVAFILTANVYAAAFFNKLMWIFSVSAFTNYCLWKEG